jgi:glyoxylase-like metal-dependent hydrolase (beta-lactamase superfamily II)
MKVHTIHTGFFKLDGGAMFGVVPKSLWQKLNPPDEQNLCTWAMRCLLIEHGDRRILVDTGIGDKQDEKFFSHFHPHGDTSLLGELARHCLQPNDITDVFLTHLHFDHVGGAVRRDDSGALLPTFPRARYWTNERHLHWALHPNDREKASFLQENIVPLQEAGVLHFLADTHEELYEWLPGLQVEWVHGHTEGMMLLHIDTEGQHLVYCADLLPSSYHIPMPYVMAYDVRPLHTLDEKASLLHRALENNWILVYEHDPVFEASRLRRDDRGRIVAHQAGSLAALLQ